VALIADAVRRFGTARWTYNQCLSLVKKVRTLLKKKELRARVVNNGNNETENAWVKDTPYEVRDGAMNDVLQIQLRQGSSSMICDSSSVAYMKIILATGEPHSSI
jgi:hypothetical protein